MPSPATTSRRSAVDRHAKSLKETLRQSRSRASRKQDDEHARSVAKAVLSSNTSRAIEYTMTLVVDLAHRCDNVADAESIGQSFVAIARAEWAAAHPTAGVAQLSRAEASIAEQMAQGDRENAEKAMDLDPKNVSKRLAFLAASATHTHAARQLDEAVRRELAQEAR